ncbi:MAG: type II secretion system F family protein [Gammaproteobacteria bacterium]
MPTFEYKATTEDGKLLSGQRESNDKASLILWLQESNYIPISVEEVNANSLAVGKSLGLLKSNQLTNNQVLEITEQLSTLIRSKLPLDHALKILQQISEHKNVKELIGKLLESVQAGNEFSTALEEQKEFSPFYINMIRASEASGNLDSGLNQLYRYLDSAKQIRDKLKSALLYPLILLIVAGASIVLILLFVVPKITELFVGTDQALPIPTQIVIGMSNAVIDYWWIIPICIVMILYYLKFISMYAHRKRPWHNLLLKTPLIKDLIIRTETAKFSKSLGTLISNGVNMQTALPIANATLTNVVFHESMKEAIEEFKEGKSLFGIMSKVKHFPTLAVQMINVGEETGELESMLTRVGEIYDREISNATQRFLALLEPLLIVTLGIMIGGIIISILMAIISVNDIPL